MNAKKSEPMSPEEFKALPIEEQRRILNAVIGYPSLSGPDTWRSCKTREEFEKYLFDSFARYYGLTCTCDDGKESDFRQAAGHYQRCAYWKFCHAVSRSLDWAEQVNGILP